MGWVGSIFKSMRKRFLAILVFMMIVITMEAQIQTNSWHDGYWGQWKSHSSRIDYRYNEYSLYGGYSGFIIYKKNAHPSEYIFSFQINSYVVPDKKTIKYHQKNNIWYEYSGTVEYYVTERYPTIEAVLREFEFPYFNRNSGSPGNPCVKRTTNATIKIEPYKKHPVCYNIYFDNIGVAITPEGVHF